MGGAGARWNSVADEADAGPAGGGSSVGGTVRLPAGGVVAFDDEGVRTTAKVVADDGSETVRIGNLIGTGGPAGPTRDGIQQAIREQDAISSSGASTPPPTTTSAPAGSNLKVGHAGIGVRRDPNGSVTVVDPNNNTETTVRRDGSTITHDATTGKKLDETPALQNVGQPGSSEGETPVDDEDEPANDTSERSSTRTGRAKSLIRTGRARSRSPIRRDDPNGQSLVPEDEVTGGADDPEDGQSLDPETRSGRPELSIPSSTPKARASNQSPRRIRTDRAPSLRARPIPGRIRPRTRTARVSSPSRSQRPERRARGLERRRGSDDEDDGQSTEDEQSTEGEQSAEQEGDPGGDEGGGVTLPPEISEAIQSDINRLRGARTVTGDGATDPADDAGGVVDKTIAVPDKKGQLLGGDNFSPADDGALVGRAVPVSGPVGTSGGDIDFGPDHDDGVQTSGPEQDPFDSGPEIKPVGSNTTSDDEEDDDDGGLVGSPLIAKSVVRSSQFDRVPASVDEDPDDD